ncbi:MAG TPA: hypothetical protein VGQ12_05035 [Candidatus Angelobacter sp.]|jgi:hypothetical protein|nr:hypothetical protein [Candidatus Angelobacter sp.]
MNPSEKLMKLLASGLLSAKNAERIARVFCDATKIVYERQKQLKKPQLKMKEISSALVLAESLHSQAFRFEATGHLAENFGQFDEGKALTYYDQKVIGTVKDIHGRSIVIDDDGMRSLYKDPESGKHIVAAENYEEGRGKRLPWIRFTLQNSHAIYVSDKRINGAFRRVFLFTAIVSIPLDPKPQVSYYVVVVRERKNGDLQFVTAYSMFQINKFLSIIALTSQFGQR